MTEIRTIRDLLADDIAPLLAASRQEGFRFVERLVDEWSMGQARFARPGEVLLGCYVDNRLVAIGGLTADPYSGAPRTGRLRHLYVLPALRRQGIGGRLVNALESVAAGSYGELILRTDTSDGAQFYERLGYEALLPGGTATHRRWLVRPGEISKHAI